MCVKQPPNTLLNYQPMDFNFKLQEPPALASEEPFMIEDKITCLSFIQGNIHYRVSAVADICSQVFSLTDCLL